MFESWNGFIEFLEAHDCVLVNETDWGFHIYRRKGNGKTVGLDMSSEIDSFMVCSICKALQINIPEEWNSAESAVNNIKNDLKNR